jgi:hypothetical protein
VAEANVDEEKLELFELQEVAGIEEDGKSARFTFHAKNDGYRRVERE